MILNKKCKSVIVSLLDNIVFVSEVTRTVEGLRQPPISGLQDEQSPAKPPGECPLHSVLTAGDQDPGKPRNSAPVTELIVTKNQLSLLPHSFVPTVCY